MYSVTMRVVSFLGPVRLCAAFRRTPPKLLLRNYSKIYTKTGDKGTSALFTGARKPKDDAIFNALGATDELSSLIGVAAEFCSDANLNMEEQLLQIQCILQDVGSSVATPSSTAREAHLKKVEFSQGYCDQLETWIDDMTQELPPLRNFILPSGGKSATHLHLARAVCRRAERDLTPLYREGEVPAATFVFVNRLSDYLFTAARFAAMKEGREEHIYRRVKPSRESQ